MTENTMIIIKLDKDLKRKYRKKCIDNDITMRSEITEHITEYVDGVVA
jgi:hypothetical protein